MALSGYVTRTSLGLPNLSLFGAEPYLLTNPSSAVNAGETTATEIWADSNWTSDVLVASVDKHVAMTLLIEVYGSGDEATLNGDLSTLFAAFTQQTYTLSLTLGTQTYQWSCWRRTKQKVAFDATHWFSGLAHVTLTVPRNPVALAGAI